MRAGGGKQKGASFERDVCRDLSLWVSGGTDEDLFWRSAMSGGRATVGKKTRGVLFTRQCGDVTATSKEGCSLTDRFYIECKFYAKLDIQSFIFLGKGKLAEFWHETAEAAASYGKRPMLIARQNRLKPFVVLGPDGGSTLLKKWPLPRRICVSYKFGVVFVWLEDLVAAAYKAR